MLLLLMCCDIVVTSVDKSNGRNLIIYEKRNKRLTYR